MRISVERFKGELPRLASELRPDGYAQRAVNCRLLSGNLEAWKNFELIEHLCKSGVINTIYPLHDPADALLIYWLHWTDDELAADAVEVDVAESTLAGDTTGRVYLTGLDVPRWTNKAMATDGSGCLPITTRPLGVINPDNPPVLDVVGAGGTTSVTFTDGFDDTSLWNLSSDFNDGSSVRHAEFNTNGNPGTCLQTEANNSNDCAYAYRDTGAAAAAQGQLRFQVYCQEPNGANVWNWMAGFNRSLAGAGIIVTCAFGVGQLNIGTVDSWGQLVGMTVYGSAAGAQPPIRTWIQVVIDWTRSTGGLCDITATVSSLDGATIYSTLTATDVPSQGGYMGFGNDSAALGGVRLRFDNIQFNGQNIPDDTSNDITTSYVYTFVADNGDGTFSESGPSPASVTISKDSATTVTVTTDTSTPSGFDYHVVAKRIYRAVTGATSTAFHLLVEIPLAQADFVDTISDSEAAQGDTLPSEGWDLPPSNMRGILALPNDIYAGFHDNVLDLSAQGQPHAYPVKYRLATDKKIIGIGAIDTMVVIATAGFPYIAAGNSPDAYSMAKIEFPQACVSKRSVCYVNGVGVVYASPDGMVSVAGPGRAELITTQIFTRDEWRAFNPPSMICRAHDNRIFVQYEKTDGTRGMFLLETTQDGFGKVSLAFSCTAMMSDLPTDKLYLVLDDNDPPSNAGSPRTDQVVPDGRTIYAFDSYEGGSPTLSMKLPYLWESKLYMLDKPTTFRYGRVQASSFDDLSMTVEANGGVAYFTKEVAGQEEFTLPDLPAEDGADDFNIMLIGTDKVRTVQVVEGADEVR